MADDQIKVTHDNNGRFYRIKMDLAKEGSEIWDLTPYFKGRVGDNRFGLQVVWTCQGRLLDTTGMKPYIEGNVGNYSFDDKKDLQLAPDAATVRYTGNPSDCQSGGRVTYYFPEQMFPRDGIFKGYIGLLDDRDDSSQPHISGVTVWFRVLPGIAQMGHACDVYISDLDKALQNFKETLRQHNIDYENQLNSNNAEFQRQVQQVIADARNAYNSQVANSRDAMNALDAEVKANRAELTNINDHLAGVEQQIAIHDIVTIPQHQEDLKNISNAIDERLANVKTAPVAVENATTLQQRYPNGADGIFIAADTGDKWLWLSGQWTDCGQYQAIGISDELIQPIKQQQLIDEENIATNSNLINQHTDRIKENITRIQNLEGAGQLTDILITDQAGNHITDSYGNRIGGYKWLPLTDVTLTQAGLPADGQAVGEAITDILDPHAERYDIPVLYLYSELIPSLKDKSIALENKVKYKFPKYGISGVLKKLKVQGRTSAGLPEKNYTLNFDKKTTIFSDFGYQNKYVIKANYTDFSQAKNVVSAKVWGAVRHQHDAFETIQTNAGDYLTDEAGNHIQGICDPQLSISKTAGAIDGFPIALYVNDKFAGLYTFNIPKDDWMAKMPNKDGYAMVSVDWSNLDHQVDTTNTSDFGDVEIEFCGTKDTAWVQKSFNDLITALNQDYTDQSHFDMAIDPLLDLDSAIDYYCYSVLIGNIDGINSNFIFQTFDKTKWYIAAYDLDKTYGTTTDFETVIRPNSDNQNADLQQGIKRYGITFENMAKNSKLFSQLWKLHEDDILNRTKELISTVMSPEEIACTFYDFTQKIPLALYNADAKRWPQKPYTSLLNSNQISLWYSQRINFIKQKYLSDKGEK